MCSRICLASDVEVIRSRFGIAGGKTILPPHWNIAAGGVLAVIRWDAFLRWRRLDLMRWGLIPRWAKSPFIVRTTLPAYSLDENWADQLCQAGRRCLVAIDNFYAWRLCDKQPFAVALANRQLMALAGVWDLWTSPSGERIECFAIVTRTSNTLLTPLCKEMPAIVFPADWDLWLGKDQLASTSRISEMLKACPEDQLTIWPIDRRVANAKNDDPGILATIEL